MQVRSIRQRPKYLYIVLASAIFFLLAALGACFVAKTAAAPPAVAPLAPGIESSIHVALGVPKDADDSDDWLMDKEFFIVSYNHRLNAPNWVAWNLSDRYLGVSPRTPTFHSDIALPTSFYVVKDSDYTHTGYDRGHLCPSADRSLASAMNQATFVLTNTQPQEHALNAGPWEKLEVHERELAKLGKELYVVAGGIFDEEPKRIGNDRNRAHQVAVPRANYKIVVVLERGQGAHSVEPNTPVIAAIMPNSHDASLHDWPFYQVSVRAIEEATGYDFLSRVPKNIQNIIETRAP
jgi:endonuclease G